MSQGQKGWKYVLFFLHVLYQAKQSRSGIWATACECSGDRCCSSKTQKAEGGESPLIQGRPGLQSVFVASLRGRVRPRVKETTKINSQNAMGEGHCRYGHCFTGTTEPPCGDNALSTVRKESAPCTLYYGKRERTADITPAPILRYRLLCKG